MDKKVNCNNFYNTVKFIITAILIAIAALLVTYYITVDLFGVN